MGGEPYWYFVKYKPDLDAVLQELREREFRAGRYNPAMPFPLDPTRPAPGAQHASIREAFEDADADGTRSILDIQTIGEEPDFCVAVPLDDEQLESLYGTTTPTREQLEENMDYLEDIERGHCVYAIAHKNGQPDEVLFAGYSFD
jgi:hypothetical protein